jgi:hypothetical protein
MARRGTKIVVGAAVGLVGGIVAVGGGVLMAFVGSDSAFATDRESISTTTTALVTKIDDIGGMDEASGLLGRASLRVQAESGAALFVGVGPAAAVDRYLAGVDIDLVDDLEVEPFELQTTHRVGSVTPAVPSAQAFWIVDAASPDLDLTWKLHDGDYRLVIMNADASKGVHTEARFAVKLPHLYPLGVGLLAGGGLVVLAGAVVFVLGLRTPPAPTNGRPTDADTPTPVAVS